MSFSPNTSVPGKVFWIFGLSGAGKSTVAAALAEHLKTGNFPVLILDGDALRAGLSQDLGFSIVDTTENIRRAAEVARLGSESGLSIIASFITPLESQRNLVKAIIGQERVAMIFANAPVEVCRQRDTKGLYGRARAGELQSLAGVTADFEYPNEINLDLPTSNIQQTVSIQLLCEFARTLLGLPKNEFELAKNTDCKQSQLRSEII